MEMILQPQIEKGLREAVTSHLTAFGFLLHKLHLIDPHHLAAKGDIIKIVNTFVNVKKLLSELAPLAETKIDKWFHTKQITMKYDRNVK